MTTPARPPPTGPSRALDCSYLDIAEAIEDGDAHSGLDNSDFVNTEIPFEFSIPDKSYLSDEERERVRCASAVWSRARHWRRQAVSG